MRGLSILVLALAVRGCVTYDFDHEIWLKTDGSGSLTVTGEPWMWTAFKKVGDAKDPEGTVTPEVVRQLFEKSGVEVQNARKTTRAGHTYISVTGRFKNIVALNGTPAFPDLVVSLNREGQRMRLFGVWRRPIPSQSASGHDTGQMALRFHVPSKIYVHRNASLGVERGNILSWIQGVSSGASGAPIDFGATIGTESILGNTLRLFALAVFGACLVIAAALFALSRRRFRVPSTSRQHSSPPKGGSDFSNYDPLA